MHITFGRQFPIPVPIRVACVHAGCQWQSMMGMPGMLVVTAKCHCHVNVIMANSTSELLIICVMQAASDGNLHTLVSRCSMAFGDWFMVHVLDVMALHASGPALLQETLPHTGTSLVSLALYVFRLCRCTIQGAFCPLDEQAMQLIGAAQLWLLQLESLQTSPAASRFKVCLP